MITQKYKISAKLVNRNKKTDLKENKMFKNWEIESTISTCICNNRLILYEIEF